MWQGKNQDKVLRSNKNEIPHVREDRVAVRQARWNYRGSPLRGQTWWAGALLTDLHWGLSRISSSQECYSYLFKPTVENKKLCLVPW